MPFHVTDTKTTIYYQLHCSHGACSVDDGDGLFWLPLSSRPHISNDSVPAHLCTEIHPELTGQPLGHGVDRLLFIMGYACPHTAWKSTVDSIISQAVRNNRALELCIFDNRGIGLSSQPSNPSDYNTGIMAADALSLVDHLGWSDFHLIGHSMGGMIAAKLAAMAPAQVRTLTLICTCLGGWDLIPSLSAVRLLPKLAMVKTREDKIRFDLDCHYSPQYTSEYVDSADDPSSAAGPSRVQRSELLFQSYRFAGDNDGSQTNEGGRGHWNAVKMHSFTRDELRTLSTVKACVVHGDADLIIAPSAGRRLARKIGCPYYEFQGGHFLVVERAAELRDLIFNTIEGRVCLTQVPIADATATLSLASVDGLGTAAAIKSSDRRRWALASLGYMLGYEDQGRGAERGEKEAASGSDSGSDPVGFGGWLRNVCTWS